MRFVRLSTPSGPRYARLVSDDRAELLSGAPYDVNADGGRATAEIVTFSKDDLLEPVTPRKILCVGRNYAAHAKELGNDVPKEPLLFLKPTSALLRPFGTIVLPPSTISERVEHEAELAIVIGRTIKNASPDEALRSVFGYTCAGDITARDLQKKDGQFTRAKGFDTFCPVGPHVETDCDPRDLRVQCFVRDQARQDGRTRDMVFAVPDLLSYMSHMMTLEAGDLILTGTPEGVGPLVSGDTLRIEIEKIGALCTNIAGAPAA
ncbi:MAG: fumarylacetoacetate hydrolase family protein [Polyangiaceae bacterium]